MVEQPLHPFHIIFAAFVSNLLFFKTYISNQAKKDYEHIKNKV